MLKSSRVELKKSKDELAKHLNFLANMIKLLLKEIETLNPDFDIRVKEGIDFKQEIKKLETQLIEKALKHTKGNQKQAAELLKLKATTLHSKIKTLRIWEKSS